MFSLNRFGQQPHVNGSSENGVAAKAQAQAIAQPPAAAQLMDVMRQRRSVFPKDMLGHTQAPVSREEVEALLEAANWAPTHGKTEPWRYVALSQGPKLQEMLELSVQCNKEAMAPEAFEAWSRKFAKKRAQFDAVSYFLMICMKRQANPGKLQPEWEEMAATSCSVQNLYLMTHAMGLGGYWSSWQEAAREHPAFKAFLGLEPQDKCLGVFLLGRPGPNVASYRSSRGPVADKVQWL